MQNDLRHPYITADPFISSGIKIPPSSAIVFSQYVFVTLCLTPKAFEGCVLCGKNFRISLNQSIFLAKAQSRT